MRCLFFALALVSCARAEKKIDDVEPTQDDVATYEQVSINLSEHFIYGGFGVVSLKPDGSPEHLGEALIWGGTYLWAASCDRGRPVSEAMARMVSDHGGQIIRVDPLGEYAGGRAVTLDGWIGAAMGIARRIQDCGEANLWRQPFADLIAFQKGNSGLLNADSSSRLEGGFVFIRDAIAAKLGLRDEPDHDRQIDFEKTVAAWPGLVKLAHATGVGSDACFRVNLALSSLLTQETLNKWTSDQARDEFCAGSDGMDIPTADHFCGRRPIAEYLASYQPDRWEYRHQRCGAWEQPDGDGNVSPQLDRLVALVMAHGWQTLQSVR